jgi:hypothetical protein
MAMSSSADSEATMVSGSFGLKLVLPLLLAVLSVAAGCATTVNDSDIPWNDPQPWEGSPAIPGISGGNGRY